MADAPYSHGDPSLEPEHGSVHRDMPFAGIEEVAGLESARLQLRQAGYCAICDRIVERAPEGGCECGHPEAAMFGRMMLEADEAIPRLPRFNLGAFLMPFLWGPGHGQWVGAFFLPIWLFMDSIVRTAITGPNALKVAATFVVVATVAFEAHFAKRANGLAWRRVYAKMTVDEFVRRERLWTVAMIPLFVAFFAWAVYYDVARRESPVADRLARGEGRPRSLTNVTV